MNYVAYYRVSTEDQGKSGLGLAAQMSTCRDFISRNGNLVGEFQDILSGTNDNRGGLHKAIMACKASGAVLIVKSLTRITREGYGIQALLDESGVDYYEAASPNDTPMIKGIKLEVSKEEVRAIKKRTKDALDQIKEKIAENGYYVSKAGRKITSLGNPSNLSEVSRANSIKSRKRGAITNPNNVKAGALVVALRESGSNYNQIAKELNNKGFKTRRGCEFTRVQAQRLYLMYKK